MYCLSRLIWSSKVLLMVLFSFTKTRSLFAV
nr:MAG TPA: hypothetical protein [Caudoviricetes sp.]